MVLGKMLLAMILSLGITLASYPVAIPILHKLKFGQTVREEGPESHKQKTGTPTMGGLVFIFSSIITSLLVNFNGIHSMGYLVVVLAFVGYGIIGFIDDYLIVVRKNNDGLKPSLKFLMQSVLAVAFYLIYRNVTNSLVIVPFLNIYLDLHQTEVYSNRSSKLSAQRRDPRQGSARHQRDRRAARYHVL